MPRVKVAISLEERVFRECDCNCPLDIHASWSYRGSSGVGIWRAPGAERSKHSSPTIYPC